MSEGLGSGHLRKEAYRPAELAEDFGGTPQLWLDFVKRGELIGRKVGRRTVLILAGDLAAFLERHRMEPRATKLDPHTTA